MKRTPARLGAVIFIAALFASACSVQSLTGPDDKAIISEIQSKLFQDSVLKTQDIRVTSNKGVVVLTGTVQTELQKAAVERLAGQASGVKQVQNELNVGSSPIAQDAPPAKEQAAVDEPVTPPERPTARPTAREKARQSARTKTHPRESMNASASNNEEETPPSEATPKTTTTTVAEATPPPPPPPPPPVHITIPAGTVITVRMIDGVDSSRDHAGQDFGASVAAAVVVGDRVVIPQGSDAKVRLVAAKNAGHMTGQSEVELELAGVTVAGSEYDVATTTYSQTGASRGKRTAETVGGGAVLGGLIGAIAGHGKGAAIGSVIGAGAGTAAQAATKAPPMKVPPETKIDFTLKVPVQVTLPPAASGTGE